MKMNRLCAAVLATTMTVGVAVTTTPTVYAADNQPARNAAQQAFDYWAPRLLKSSPTFTLPNIGNGGDIKWVLPITNDRNIWETAAEFDPEFRKRAQNPPKLADLKNGVKKLTPAVTDDGVPVTVLPFDKSNLNSGLVALKDLLAGLTIQATEDKDSKVPIGAPDDSIRLLYSVVNGGKESTSGFDWIDSATPDVSLADLEVGYNNGRKNSPEFEKITNFSITPVNPETLNTINETMRLLNRGKDDVISLLEVLRTPRDGEKGDPAKGGLVPVVGKNGKPIKMEKKVGQGKHDVKHEIEFTSPKEGEQVYLMHRVTDKNGNDVVQPDMRTVSSMKPTLDVQASSQQGSRKLGDKGKQTIYNQAKVRQLTPGKPYQVLVNLSQCNPTDGCTEVAAVNREIIPRDTTERTENFAVDIDTSNIDDNNTFEWSTTVYEGTGDVKKMGQKLVAVDDHPSSQVLSSSGDGKSLNKAEAGQRVEKHADEKKLEIKNEAPPASMDEVRKNNEQLDAENDKSMNNPSTPWLIGLGITAFVAVVAGSVWFRGRANATSKGV